MPLQPGREDLTRQTHFGSRHGSYRTRIMADYIVTEYGIARMKGKTREKE